MARTQKNKATMGHLGLLKARLAKLRRELIEPKGGGGGTGEGFDVAKTGDARIGFVGQCVVVIFYADFHYFFSVLPHYSLSDKKGILSFRKSETCASFRTFLS